MRDPFPLGSVRVRRKEGKGMGVSRASLFREVEGKTNPAHMGSPKERSAKKGDGASLSSAKLQS